MRSCLVVSTAVSSLVTSGVASVPWDVDADDLCSSVCAKLGDRAKNIIHILNSDVHYNTQNMNFVKIIQII